MTAGRIVAFAFGAASGLALVLGAPVAASDPPPQEHGGRFGHQAHDQTVHHDEVAQGEATAPEIGFRGCAYFEDSGFGGRRGEAREGAYVEWLGAAWNDRISSVACAPGCRLIGYENINYGGARRNFTGATGDVGPMWNDRISALRAVCAAETPDHAPHGPSDADH